MGLGRLERDRRCGSYLEQDRCRGRKVAQMLAVIPILPHAVAPNFEL